MQECNYKITIKYPTHDIVIYTDDLCQVQETLFQCKIDGHPVTVDYFYKEIK